MNPIPINNSSQKEYVHKMLKITRNSNLVENGLKFKITDYDFNQNSDTTCTTSIFSKCENETYKIIKNPNFLDSNIEKFFFLYKYEKKFFR